MCKVMRQLRTEDQMGLKISGRYGNKIEYVHWINFGVLWCSMFWCFECSISFKFIQSKDGAFNDFMEV